MRNITIVALYLLCTNEMFAAPDPPPPGLPPVPPGAPLDENLMLYLMLSIAYGIYKVYQYQKKMLQINLKHFHF
jgi:hypothetical protein